MFRRFTGLFLLVVLWFSLVFVGFSHADSLERIIITPETIEKINGDYWIRNEYDLWVNGSSVPINQTFFEIPSLNYSVTFEQMKNTPAKHPSFQVVLFKPSLQNTLNDSYYYSAKLSLPIVDNFTLPNLQNCFLIINVTMFPFEIRNYYFKDFYKFLSLFTSNGTINQDVSYGDVLSLWGPSTLTPFVFENNTKFIPLIGPYNWTYYDTLKEEAEKINQEIIGNEGLKDSITNYTVYYWKQKDLTPDNTYYFPVLALYFQLILSLSTPRYDANITLIAELSIHNTTRIDDFDTDVWISFYDKVSHTRIEIKQDFGFAHPPPPVFCDDSTSTHTSSSEEEEASFELTGVLGTLILTPIIKRLKKTPPKKVNYF